LNSSAGSSPAMTTNLTTEKIMELESGKTEELGNAVKVILDALDDNKKNNIERILASYRHDRESGYIVPDIDIRFKEEK